MGEFEGEGKALAFRRGKAGVEEGDDAGGLVDAPGRGVRAGGDMVIDGADPAIKRSGSLRLTMVSFFRSWNFRMSALRSSAVPLTASRGTSLTKIC
jgi:hypothetical protein